MSTMSSNNKPTIAFLGATGGSTNAILTHALLGGHNVVALARTPSKLTTQLQDVQGLSPEMLDRQLTIVSGNALNTADLKNLLTVNNTPNHLVSQIVVGVGAYPVMRMNWCKPLQFIELDSPDLCAKVAHTLLTSLAEIYTTTPALKMQKPHITFISTTGISRGAEDVPLGMRFLYHQLLKVPHDDKKAMEEIYRNNVDGKDNHGPLLASYVGIRPTLLTGDGKRGTGLGHALVRSGREASPVQGWTVSRTDVGEWVYENVLKDMTHREKYANDMISLAN